MSPDTRSRAIRYLAGDRADNFIFIPIPLRLGRRLDAGSRCLSCRAHSNSNRKWVLVPELDLIEQAHQAQTVRLALHIVAAASVISSFLFIVSSLEVWHFIQCFQSIFRQGGPNRLTGSKREFPFVGMKITDRNPATSVNGLRPSSIFVSLSRPRSVPSVTSCWRCACQI